MNDRHNVGTSVSNHIILIKYKNKCKMMFWYFLSGPLQDCENPPWRSLLRMISSYHVEFICGLVNLKSVALITLSPQRFWLMYLTAYSLSPLRHLRDSSDIYKMCSCLSHFSKWNHCSSHYSGKKKTKHTKVIVFSSLFNGNYIHQLDWESNLKPSLALTCPVTIT